MEKLSVFKGYLITAYRNLLRFKLDSFLNISGLVVGLSAALLIVLFIQSAATVNPIHAIRQK